MISFARQFMMAATNHIDVDRIHRDEESLEICMDRLRKEFDDKHGPLASLFGLFTNPIVSKIKEEISTIKKKYIILRTDVEKTMKEMDGKLGKANDSIDRHNSRVEDIVNGLFLSSDNAASSNRRSWNLLRRSSKVSHNSKEITFSKEQLINFLKDALAMRGGDPQSITIHADHSTKYEGSNYSLHTGEGGNDLIKEGMGHVAKTVQQNPRLLITAMQMRNGAKEKK